MRSTVTVAGQSGYLFESGNVGSYCFVPQDCVHVADDGRIIIDEVRYFRSGWALRNMRCAPTESPGTFLFPDSNRMVSDFGPALLKQFLATAAGR